MRPFMTSTRRRLPEAKDRPWSRPHKEPRDASRFAKVFSGPPRRHGLDGLSPAHRTDRYSAECPWGRTRPPARRTPPRVLLCPRVHQPITTRLEDVSVGGLW